jgi:autotransporter-associated beta strand protein
VGLLAAAAVVRTQAQTTYTWNSPTTGTANWSAATWGPSTPPAGGAPGDTLNFANGTYDAVNDLSGTFLLGTLNINSGSGAVSLDGNALEFTNSGDLRLANNSSALLTVDNSISLNGPDHWYITPGGNITFNGVISGTVADQIFVTDQGGTVTFANANNNFTCPIGVNNEGTLVAAVSAPNGANGAFGNSTQSIMLPNSSGNNTTLALYGATGGVEIDRRINAAVQMGASGTRIIGGLNSSGWVTFGNYIDGPDGQAVILYAAAGGGVQFNDGVIGAPSRTSSVIYAGGGQFSIYALGAGGNTYSGTTTVRAGYVYLNGNDTGTAGNYALGSSATTTAVQLGDAQTPAGAPISVLTSGPYTISHNFSVNNYGGTIVLGSGSTQPSTFTGAISLRKSVYLQDYTASLAGTTFAGPITDSGAGMEVVITGNGTIILTAGNSFAGGVYVTAGNALLVDNASGSGTGSGLVTVPADATLGGTGTIGGSVAFGSGSLAVFTYGQPLTIEGPLVVATNGTLPVAQVRLPANLGAGIYTLARYSSNGSSGSFFSTPTILSGSLASNLAASVTTSGGQVSLVVSATTSARLTLASGDNPSAAGDTLIFAAAINPAPPNGESVLLYDETTNIGTAALLGGTASFTNTTLSVGVHYLTAVYPGDGIYAGATSGMLSQTVTSAGITLVQNMPDLPSPFEMVNWKSVASNYDAFVFNSNLSGAYLPLIKTDKQYSNFIIPWFALPDYVGVTNYTEPSAIDAMAAILGATLVGIDKSDQAGVNWVPMMAQYYNHTDGLNVLFDNSLGTISDFWYQLLPHILFAGLVDRYPSQATVINLYSATGGGASMNDIVSTCAQNWYGACQTMGGTSNTAPNFNWNGFNFGTGLPFTNSWIEPEGAAGVAWFEYMAWRHFGQTNADYLQAADWGLQFMQNSGSNVLYEVLLPYGVVAAARMNAEVGRNYDINKFINWCFNGNSYARPGWGVTTGSWGGMNVDGLVANVAGNGYAFAMDTFEFAGALAPVARYDQRFAHDLGKWLLNAANNSRLFYAPYLPAGQQASPGWLNGTNAIIPYEGLMQSYNGTNLYATGDAVRSGWAATDYALYGGSHVGLFGALFAPTSDSNILQIDLLATDYFKDTNYPTYLYYNPHASNATFVVNYGAGTNDLLDITTEQFLVTRTTGAVSLTLPPDTARVVVVIPSGAAIGTQGARMYANGHVVDYRYSGIDSDGDGLPDWWESRYFGNPTNASPTAAGAGGYDNLQCYQLGVSPLATNVFNLTLNIQNGSGLPQLSWATIGGRTYTVAAANGLGGTNAFQGLYTVTETNVAVGMPGRQTYVDPTSVNEQTGDARDYRVQVP